MQELHQLTLQVLPGCKLWFGNGKNSENKTGISVYILGIKDKTYLAQTYGKKLGKASVTGYCEAQNEKSEPMK